MDLVKCIRNSVRIDLGIKSQLIDQPIHLVSFIIDGADISVHLLRRVCHAVHDAFHITLDSCDRCLQIMGNIADQFLIFLVKCHFFFSRLLQAFAHFLKIIT